MRLTSTSDGRGKPLRAVVESWAAGNPRIRRVWASVGPAEDIALTLELQPVGDSEETLAVWMAHGERWRRELQRQLGQAVGLDWQDPDGATEATPPAESGKMLLYERASV